jgi:ABC-type uncharacterized transport system ATPase subunit
MQTILSSFDLNAHRRSLSAELAGVDERQLLDIGLVRAADGSLRLADDPSQPIGPERERRRLRAFFAGVAGLFRWVRSLPLRSPDWHPHFFLRE